jgi:MSHA biogenesis protein MshK
MDALMNRARMVLALAAGLLGAGVAAQTVVDPTRPPVNAYVSEEKAAQQAVMPVSVGPQLQSVLVSTKPGGRRVAVIDGKTIRLGERFDGAVLVKVTEKEAVLQRGASKQVLKLAGDAVVLEKARVEAGNDKN